MNALIEKTLTMNSLEIAELVQKRHDSVKRTIETLAENGVIQLPQSVEVVNYQSLSPNNRSKAYTFKGEEGKRDSIIVVAQLSPEFTARLVDRWQELERQAQAPQLPQNYLEALKALVHSEEEKALLAAKSEEQAAKIAQDAPKVSFAERHAKAEGWYTLREAAKVLGLAERTFIDSPLKCHYLFRGKDGGLLVYAEPLKRGLFDMRSFVFTDRAGREKNRAQVMVLPKGLQHFHKRFVMD